MTEYGSFTSADITAALMFSQDQVARETCEAMTGASFRPDSKIRYWDFPCKTFTNLPCRQSSDCGAGLTCNQEGFCAYCPNPADISPGTCNIASKELCMRYSTDPYVCDTDGCRDKTKAELAGRAYLEWREVPCGENTTCPNGQPCKGNSCSCATSTDCPGAQECVDGSCSGPSCIYGNYPLKQFCEWPISRGADDLKQDPPNFYDSNTGECYVTKRYCDHYGVGYNLGKCADGCKNGTRCDEFSGYCSGPGAACTESTGQKVGEFLLGKDAFRWFKGGFECPDQTR